MKVDPMQEGIQNIEHNWWQELETSRLPKSLFKKELRKARHKSWKILCTNLDEFSETSGLRLCIENLPNLTFLTRCNETGKMDGQFQVRNPWK